MAFKMNGWQSHSDSPHKFIGKRFRRLRKSIGAGLRASTGLIGGMFGGGGVGNVGGPSDFSVAGMVGRARRNRMIQEDGIADMSAQGNVDIPLVKKKNLKKKK
jgi:hypothetical protein|tara:strand:+ start:684 stop:992 length:309 start_codon:yes stop_codon:yes gene_type:complete